MFIYPVYNHNWRNINTIYVYITRLASNEIFSPSNKIHREVGLAKDLSAPRYFSTQIRLMVTSILTNWLTHSLTNWLTNQHTKEPTNRLHVWVLGKLTGPQSSLYFMEPQCLLPHSQGCKYTEDYLILKPMKELLSFHILLGLTLHILKWYSSASL